MPFIPILRRIAQGPPAGKGGPPPGSSDGSSNPFSGMPAANGSSRISQEDSHTIVAVLTTLLVLCTIAVTCRLISRRLLKLRLGIDDLWVAAALLLFAGQAAVVYYNQDLGSRVGKAAKALHSGKGSLRDLSSFAAPFAKAKIAASLLYLFTITAARLSVLFLSRRVFNMRVMWFRIAWWTCTIVVTVYWFYFVVAILAQCAPNAANATWQNPSACKHAPLSNPAAQGISNVVIDAALWTLPIRMIWTLQLSKRQKWAVSGVFALGSMFVVHPPHMICKR